MIRIVPATLFFLCFVSRAEVVLLEDFERFSLKPISTRWTATEPNDLSVETDPSRGKVFHIKAAGGGSPGIAYAPDLTKIGGKSVKLSISIKMPGSYAPNREKPAAAPRVMLMTKDKAGNELFPINLCPLPGKADWQELSGTALIPDDIKGASIVLTVQLVTAEVFFDKLLLEVAADAADSSAPVSNAPQKFSPSKQLADKAPRKTIDLGTIFNPEVANNLQGSLSRSASTPRTIMVIGPGAADKDLVLQAPKGWTLQPQNPRLNSASLSPLALMGVLPDFIAKDKPEVVIIVGDAAPGRKALLTEREDWEDLAKLCLRMGVAPVLAIPVGEGAEEKNEIPIALLKAVESVRAPAVAERPVANFNDRVGSLLGLMDKHIFGRGPKGEVKEVGDE